MRFDSGWGLETNWLGAHVLPRHGQRSLAAARIADTLLQINDSIAALRHHALPPVAKANPTAVFQKERKRKTHHREVSLLGPRSG